MKRYAIGAIFGALVGGAGLAIAGYPIANTNYPLGVKAGESARIACVDKDGNPRNGIKPTAVGMTPISEGGGATIYWLNVRCP